jgi:hypothetical protein
MFAQEISGQNAHTFDPVLLERLLVYARRRLSRTFGQRLEAAEDYVHRAIELTLSGKRRCDASADMFRHLGAVISSLVSHDAESEANRLTVTWPVGGDGNPIDVACEQPSAEERLVGQASGDEQAELVVRVLSTLSDEPDLAAFVRLLMASPALPAPREMAKRLGVPVDEIYTMRKRLQRRLRFLHKVAS